MEKVENSGLCKRHILQQDNQRHDPQLFDAERIVMKFPDARLYSVLSGIGKTKLNT